MRFDRLWWGGLLVGAVIGVLLIAAALLVAEALT